MELWPKLKQILSNLKHIKTPNLKLLQASKSQCWNINKSSAYLAGNKIFLKLLAKKVTEKNKPSRKYLSLEMSEKLRNKQMKNILWNKWTGFNF